ncbi:hypothetical protein ACWFMI_14935 [Nocardiopsis terrae]
MKDITETTVYLTADNALHNKVSLEKEADLVHEIMYQTTDRDLQFALALHYLTLRKEIEDAESHYAHTTANLIVACRILGQPLVLPSA